MGKGYIDYDDDFPKSSFIYDLNHAYGQPSIQIHEDGHNYLEIEIWGTNYVDYNPLEKILKKYRKHFDGEIAINEWVESDGGLYFDPKEDEE
jgi:hypothetical protein